MFVRVCTNFNVVSEENVMIHVMYYFYFLTYILTYLLDVVV